MPWALIRNSDGSYKVKNLETGRLASKKTTKAKATTANMASKESTTSKSTPRRDRLVIACILNIQLSYAE